MIAGSASVSDAAIRCQEFDKQNMKVKFEYAVVKEEDIKQRCSPDDRGIERPFTTPT